MQIDPISLFKRLISKPRKMSYKDDVLATFRQFIKRAKAEKNEYAFDHPALLSPKHLAEIADQSPDDFANLSSPGPMAVAYLHELIDDITKHRTTYPVGRGPIERLQGRHRANEITLETAAQEASSKLSRLLSPIYIWAVSNLAQDLAQTLDWRLAVELMTILFGAVDNAPSDHEGFRMRVHAIRAWLDVVARALSHVPDGRLYEDALRRGKWLVDEADKRGNRALHSEILHRLGVLNLDPYILGKGVSNFTSDIQNWKIRQDNESQSAIIFGNRYKHMPDVVDALQLAEKYLSAAAAMRRGFGLAITSKALAQARYWLAIAGKEQDPKLMERLEKSLKTEWNRLERFRAFIKESGPGAVEVKTDIDLPAGGGDVTPESDLDFIDRFLNRTPEEITISEPDIFTLLLSVIQTSHMTAEKDPAAGMRVWEHGLKVAVLPPVQDLQLKMLYDEGLILLEKLLTGDRLNLATANSASEIEAEAVRIASLPDHENETIALAIAATISGHGEVALNLLKANEVRTCNAWARYARLTTYLVAVSHIHAAVDLYHADAYGPALTHYMKSVAGLAELQLRDLALHMWRRMEDVAGKISSGDLTAVIVDEIGATLLNAELTLGPAAGFVGRQAIRKLLGVMVDEVLFKKDPEGFLQVQFELFRIANGFRYGTVLNTRQRYNWQRDPTGTLLLQPVAKLLDTKSNADDAPPTGELLLGSYLGAAEQRQGSTEADVRAN